MSATIRSLTQDDASQVCEIYNWYVAETVASFEEEPVSLSQMRSRISEGLGEFPWLGAEEEGRLIAYAYAARWRPRSAYRFSVESTIYVRHGCTGRGIGSDLYGRLIAELRAQGFRTAIGTIALPNDASVALHEKLGFRKSGMLARMGWKQDRWVDVGYWHLDLTDETS